MITNDTFIYVIVTIQSSKCQFKKNVILTRKAKGGKIEARK